MFLSKCSFKYAAAALMEVIALERNIHSHCILPLQHFSEIFSAEREQVSVRYELEGPNEESWKSGPASLVLCD